MKMFSSTPISAVSGRVIPLRDTACIKHEPNYTLADLTIAGEHEKAGFDADTVRAKRYPLISKRNISEFDTIQRGLVASAFISLSNPNLEIVASKLTELDIVLSVIEPISMTRIGFLSSIETYKLDVLSDHFAYKVLILDIIKEMDDPVETADRSIVLYKLYKNYMKLNLPHYQTQGPPNLEIIETRLRDPETAYKSQKAFKQVA